MPKLSVGMPVYNSEDFITKSIESILNQTYDDFELIISDNSSTDSTLELCERYVRQDSRIKLIKNKVNIGASANYNSVFKRSSGKYFKWTSSNDICDKTLFYKCIEPLDRDSNIVLSFSKTRLFIDSIDDYENYNEDLFITNTKPFSRMQKVINNLELNNIMNGFIRSSALSKTKLIKPFHSSDCCLMAELSLHGIFHIIPEYLFYRRMDNKTSTANMSEQDVRAHYDPNRTKPMSFQEFKINYEYFLAVNRAKLTLSESYCAYKELFKQTLWNRSLLWDDLKFSLKNTLHGYR